MAFNELNSVEYFIIHHLTGVNLNQVQHGMARKIRFPTAKNRNGNMFNRNYFLVKSPMSLLKKS
jgi:hypothetical protein